MRLHHIAIACTDLDSARRRYRLLGYEEEARQVIAEQGTTALMMSGEGGRIELLEPLTADTPVGRFLEKRGPGLHHLAYATSDIYGELARLHDLGAPLIDQEPRRGFGGHLVAFVHPRWFGGVLVELVQEP